MNELVIFDHSHFKHALARHGTHDQEMGNLMPAAKRQGGFKRIQSDLEAIELWLHNQYRDRIKTKRAYAKELLRFLLWASICKHKIFSNLDESDIEAYFRFILNPQPHDLWCLSNPSSRPKKDSQDWKPFAGPIKTIASYNQAQAAIASCFNYLFEVHYLHFNPFRLIRMPKFNTSMAQRKIDISQRVLSADEWNLFIEILLNLPENNYDQCFHKHRLRFIVSTFYYLGLRCEELSNLKWSDFVKMNDCWLVRVAGKGRDSEVQSDTILCSTHYLGEIAQYRSFLQLGDLSLNLDDGPVFHSMTTGNNLKSATIRKLIKEHARLVSKQYKEGSISYQKMQLLSPHWLRHLCASRMNDKSIPVTHIKSHLRHRNTETTYLYIHSDVQERLEAINRVKLIDE